MQNDITPDFLRHRTRMTETTAAEALLARVSGRATATKGNAAAPATVPQDVGEPGEGNVATRAGKDIVRGVVETPRAIVAGARDAIANTLSMGDELAGWLEEKSRDTPLEFMNAGIRFTDKGVEWMSPKEARTTEPLNTGELIPDLADPKSVTGQMVKGISQFLTGMAGAGKLLKATGIPKAVGAGGYARTAAQGALANFAAFDPHQQRLSNLVQKFPVLQNPVTEYLASDPSDNAAEGRFKNAIEGLGLGMLSDGMAKGIRMLRNATSAKAAAQSETGAAMAAAEATQGLDDTVFRELGDEAAKPGSKLVDVKLVPPASGKGVEKGKVFINFARIDTSEDVKRAMQELADLSAGSIDEARRGVQSFEKIKLNAQQVDAWDVLKSRRVGEPLNAEQSLAARQLWVTATEQLQTMAERAAQGGDGNLFAFRKMIAVHAAIQQEVVSARTETARALASWRIPAGASQERLRDVQEILQQHGGSLASQQLAAKIAGLGRAGMYKEMQAVTEKVATASAGDMLQEAWINGLLSNPKTHVANITSNASVMALRTAERSVAARLARVLGDEGSVAVGEATAQWHGMMSGFRDAFRFAAKSARTGETGYGLSKIEAPHRAAITSEALNLSSDSWIGRGADMLGQMFRVPGRALAAEDEFFKTLGYRMELHAQALRQARGEVMAGEIAEGAMKARIADLIDSPPVNLRMEAVGAAEYQTFTNTPGALGQLLSRATTQVPALKILLPFTRTPANVLRFTFERTPLAPLMSQFRANVAAGGARRDLALAQMGLGTMAMMTFADMTLSGQVSGRGTPERGTRQAEMRTGWQPYSVLINGKWYAYNRLDPIGSLIGMAADATETVQFASVAAEEDPDTERLLAAASVAFAGNLVNKTYLSGVSAAIEALNDPQRSAESWLQGLAGSVIPASVAQVARIDDPYQRQVYSIMDALRSRTPGLSKDLPPRLNLWGEPIDTSSGLGLGYDMIVPIRTTEGEQEPIDKELIRIEANVTPPGRRTSFDGVTIDLGQNPKAYARYVELSGNALKHPAWGLGAKDLLNDIVTGNHPLSPIYQMRSDGPDGGKDVFIRDILLQYRERARVQVLDEFPELSEQVRDGKERQRALRAPVQN